MSPSPKYPHSIARLASGIILLAVLPGCIKMSNTYSAIPPGMWRATLTLSQDTADLADERSEGLLPFNFEVRYITEDSFIIEIHNGAERIQVTDIAMGFDRTIAKDTIRIVIPPFGSYIKAKYEEDAIEGDWWDPGRGDQYHIPFRAYHGNAHRFAVPPEAAYSDFDGRWKATMRIETEAPFPAVVVIEQVAHEATGTFLTETGDYRFLDGNIIDDRLFLSTFDGSHAYLFEAKLLEDGTLTGTYRSGNHFKTYWTAARDTQFELADPHTLTPLADSSAAFTFSLPNPSGEMIGPDDPRYAGKPKIVSIFGTWCPNCMDENAFLSDYFNKHPDTGIEVISVAFERLDSVRAMSAISRYKEHFRIPWEIVYGGSSNKSNVVQVLPALDKFVSFPTMIFLDADNHVVKIHTGFYGPATEKFKGFVREFEETITQLKSDAG